MSEMVYPSYSPAALFSIRPDSVAPCLGMRVVDSSIVVNLPNFIGPCLLVRTKEGRTTCSLGFSFRIYNTLMLEVVWSLDLFVRNR
jgi:hypothetical protein